MGSRVVFTAASKRKSVVFSNEASISTESFILAIPNLTTTITHGSLVKRKKRKVPSDAQNATLIGHEVS